MLSALIWLLVGVVIGLIIRDADMRTKAREWGSALWKKLTSRGE